MGGRGGGLKKRPNICEFWPHKHHHSGQGDNIDTRYPGIDKSGEKSVLRNPSKNEWIEHSKGDGRLVLYLPARILTANGG